VLEVLRAILPVLKFVHEHNSIHRDIKPSNIMRDRNGKLYLLDFGAVKQVTNAAAVAGSSTGIYSMGFAPPEQMAGGEVYPSTDLYALAVTALLLLTGKEAAQLFDAYSNQWKWRSSVSVSDPLTDVLDRMLLGAPNKRFQSAQEVIDALNTPKTPLTQVPPSRAAQTPNPSRPIAQPPAPNPQPPSRPRFSTLELLVSAGFSGFEGALIAIALYYFVQSVNITLGVSALILTLVIFAQFRRWIEKWDLLIIAGVTLAIVLFVLILDNSINKQAVILLAVAAGLIAIAITAMFRLIYKLLSLIF
jgi:serine/threonine-protein kinase